MDLKKAPLQNMIAYKHTACLEMVMAKVIAKMAVGWEAPK